MSTQNKELSNQFLSLLDHAKGINKSVDDYILAQSKKIKEAGSGKQIASSTVKMEGLPLPQFDGQVREYPRFQKEFIELVQPNLTPREVAFSLRKCLSKKVEATLGCCNEEVAEMLKKLDERYGELIDSVQ